MKNWKYWYGMAWAFAIFLLLMGLTDRGHAVSYNGNSTPSFPQVQSSTGLLYASVNNNGWQSPTFTEFSSGFSMDRNLWVYNHVFIFGSGSSTYSGNLVLQPFFPSGCGTAFYFNMGVRTNSTGSELYWETKRSGGCMNIGQYSSDESTNTGGIIMNLPELGNCGGISKDCILVLEPKYILTDSLTNIGDGLYIFSLDATFYNNSEGKYIYYRKSFSVDPPENAWQDFQQWWSGNDSNGYNFSDGISNLSTYTSINTENETISYRYYTQSENSLFSASRLWNFFNRTNLNDTSSGTLEYYLPTWLGSDGIDNRNLNGSTSSGTTDYFADCSGFLEVGCYIKGVYNSFIDWMNKLFPNLSFSGSSDTCSSGSTSTGTYMQKLANFIAVVNPIPPGSGSVICTMFVGSSPGQMTGYSTGEVIYHRFIPETNIFSMVIPGLVPAIERDTNIALGQNVIDIFVIVCIVVIIIYQKKPHD